MEFWLQNYRLFLDSTWVVYVLIILPKVHASVCSGKCCSCFILRKLCGSTFPSGILHSFSFVLKLEWRALRITGTATTGTTESGKLLLLAILLARVCWLPQSAVRCTGNLHFSCYKFAAAGNFAFFSGGKSWLLRFQILFFMYVHLLQVGRPVLYQ